MDLAVGQRFEWGCLCAGPLPRPTPPQTALFLRLHFCFHSFSLLEEMTKDKSLGLAASGGIALHFLCGLFITVLRLNRGMVIRKGESTCPRPLPVRS